MRLFLKTSHQRLPVFNAVILHADKIDVRLRAEQLILKVLVARLRIRGSPPLVEEVFASHPRRGVITDGKPRLSAMCLIHVVRRAGSAHARGHPTRLQRIGENIGP